MDVSEELRGFIVSALLTLHAAEDSFLPPEYKQKSHKSSLFFIKDVASGRTIGAMFMKIYGLR